MTRKEQLAQQERRMAKRLTNGTQYTPETMYWMRYNLGVLYLQQYYPQFAEALQRSPIFWKWYREIWHLNDLWIHEHLPLVMTGAQYRMNQRLRFERYKPTKTTLKAALEAVTAKP